VSNFYNRDRSKRETFVYFMRAVDRVGPVKIGCSQWPEGRLTSCSAWSPLILEIVARTPGTLTDEATLHTYFDDIRSHGEWFNPDDRLEGLIVRLAAGQTLADAIDLSDVYAGGIRRSANSLTKQSLMVRLTNAEKRAGIATCYPRSSYRPAHLNDACDQWSGSLRCADLTEVRAQIERYIDQLAAPDQQVAA
jgi:hypothetical protein